MNQKKTFLHYIRYTIPALIDLSLYSACTIVSGSVASRHINEVAMGGINIASPYASLIFAYALMFGIGGSTVISFFRGQGNEKRANEVFSMNSLTTALSLFVIGIAAYLGASPLASLMGATPENFHYVVDYLRVVALFTFFYGFSYMMYTMVLADGHPALAFYASCASCTVSLGSVFLITEFTTWGISGIALSTALGQVILTVVYLVHFTVGHSPLKFVRFRFEWKTLCKILRLGLPDAISEGSSGIFVLIFNYLVFRHIGENGVIIFSVINYMNLLAIQMLLGSTQGMQPLVSFAMGAKDPALAKRYYHHALTLTFFLSACLFIPSCFFPALIVKFFISPEKTELFRQGIHALRLFSFCFPLLAYTIPTIGFFSSIQKPNYSRVMSLFRGLIGILLLGVVMAYGFGADGIWLSPIVTELITLGMGIYYTIQIRKSKYLA